MTKNADLDKYCYSEYGIGFNAPAKFTLSNGDEFGKYLEFIIVLLWMLAIEKRIS